MKIIRWTVLPSGCVTFYQLTLFSPKLGSVELTFFEAWDQVVQILSDRVELFLFISRFHLQLLGDRLDGLLVFGVDETVECYQQDVWQLRFDVHQDGFYQLKWEFETVVEIQFGLCKHCRSHLCFSRSLWSNEQCRVAFILLDDTQEKAANSRFLFLIAVELLCNVSFDYFSAIVHVDRYNNKCGDFPSKICVSADFNLKFAEFGRYSQSISSWFRECNYLISIKLTCLVDCSATACSIRLDCLISINFLRKSTKSCATVLSILSQAKANRL